MNDKKQPSIISLLFIGLISRSPKLKRSLWKKWYNLLARHDNDHLLDSMNYGFLVPQNDKTLKPQLALYDHILKGITVTGKNTVEIGSGRGGGALYITNKYKPLLYTGIDLATEASVNSISKNDNNTLNFITGDALAIPIRSNSTDIVINVESSHCYSDFELFIKQVSMLLTNNGYFCYCDLMATNNHMSVINTLKKHQLSIVKCEDITKHVLASLDQCTADHSTKIKNNVPWYLRRAFSDFVALKDTSMYRLFESGKYSYYSILAQKINASD